MFFRAGIKIWLLEENMKVLNAQSTEQYKNQNQTYNIALFIFARVSYGLHMEVPLV